MASGNIIKLTYVTSSDFKKQENKVFQEQAILSNSRPVSDQIKFEFASVSIKESLEVDLVQLVKAEVEAAYKIVRVPCFVEHSGLIFKDLLPVTYPGGLTKAMWDALNNNFVSETNSADREAIARAVIAYCDGKTIQVFEADTHGKISSTPRGAWTFYWDTIFIPNDPNAPGSIQTYAEIVGDDKKGLSYKIGHLSQSAKAMTKFLNSLIESEPPELWGRYPD